MAEFIPDRETTGAMSAKEVASMIAKEHSASFNAICRDIDHLRAHHIAVGDIATILQYAYDHPVQGNHRVRITPLAMAEPEENVTALMGTVLRAGSRRIVSDGKSQVVTEGMIGDHSGRIPFISWAHHQLEAGETIIIVHPSMTTWHGKPQLSLSEGCMIVRAFAPTYTPYAMNPVVPLASVTPGDRAITLKVHVIAHHTEETTESASHTPEATGVVADATARLPFTDWYGHTNLTSSSDVTICNAAIQQHKGFPTVNIAEFSHITQSESTIDYRPVHHVQSLASVSDLEYAYEITLSGTVIEIQDGTGLVERCPACNRITRAGTCRSHGSVSPIKDMRMKAILDDGTASIPINGGRTISETFYGGTIDEAIEASREAMDMTIVKDTIARQLLGRSVLARGRLRTSNVGHTLEAQELSLLDTNPQSHADRVLTLRERNT